MNTDRAEMALAATITVRSVHAYLVSHGWEKATPAEMAEGDVYRMEGRQDAVLVPPSSEYADYALRIWQLAGDVEHVENRPRSAILADLTLADQDRIRLRMPNADHGDAISLSDGIGLVRESRQLLLAAACSATRPQRRFRAGSSHQAARYLERVRLGQTEPGSFVVNLLTPVSPSLADTGQTDVFPVEPFERGVTRMLVSGLRALREATDQADRGGSIDAFEERVRIGISANLCEAVANLIDFGRGLDVSVRWALTRPPPDGPASNGVTMYFRSADAPVLHEAAQLLGNAQERVGERIEGYVSALARDQSEPEGRVTIKAIIDGKLTSIKADFAPVEYSEIAEAHDHRRSISLEGDLRREGQRWHLANPRDLMVIDDDR